MSSPCATPASPMQIEIRNKGDFMNALRTRVALIALVMSVAVANAQTKIKPGFNLFSAQDDVQVG